MSDDAASWAPWQESGNTLPPTLNEQVDALRSERDALRATVDRIRALAVSTALREAAFDRKPGPVADHLRGLADKMDDALADRRALDGATQAATRPSGIRDRSGLLTDLRTLERQADAATGLVLRDLLRRYTPDDPQEAT